MQPALRTSPSLVKKKKDKKHVVLIVLWLPSNYLKIVRRSEHCSGPTWCDNERNDWWIISAVSAGSHTCHIYPFPGCAVCSISVTPLSSAPILNTLDSNAHFKRIDHIRIHKRSIFSDSTAKKVCKRRIIGIGILITYPRWFFRFPGSFKNLMNLLFKILIKHFPLCLMLLKLSSSVEDVLLKKITDFWASTHNERHFVYLSIECVLFFSFERVANNGTKEGSSFNFWQQLCFCKPTN